MIIWIIMWYIMIHILLLEITNMRIWYGIIIDHDKIHNSFEFKSHLSIKYHEFLLILQNVPMTLIAIYHIHLHITQLAQEMSYMTIPQHCYNTNNIKVYPNQLQQLTIQTNIRQFLLPPKTNNNDIIYNNINKSTYKHLQLKWKCQQQQFQIQNTTNNKFWFSN